MRWSPRRKAGPGGFSLLEMVVVLAVAAVLATALAIPLGTQLQFARFNEARRQLDEARDAVLGFATAHGRLPCPATSWPPSAHRRAPGQPSRG